MIILATILSAFALGFSVNAAVAARRWRNETLARRVVYIRTRK